MNSFIAWIGGKRLLRKAICQRFPDGFDRYVEVFGGAGWVLFHKEKHADTEVFNDINGGLVNLFRCVKHHAGAVSKEMEFLLNSRELFLSFKGMDTDNLTDIQRAARFMYLVRASYGSKMKDFGSKPRWLYDTEALHVIARRLERVIIENRSFEALIPRYDSENALFYCDPPYYRAEHFYNVDGYSFGEAEHQSLKGCLTAVKGRFILSYNDCGYVRQLYKDFKIETVSRQNNLTSRYKTNAKYDELIISNY